MQASGHCVVVAVLLALAALASSHGTTGEHRHHSPLESLSPVIGTKTQAGLSVQVSPSRVAASGGNVQVSWTGHQYPQSEDWLGLWCPADISPYDSSPVKYQMLSAAPNYKSGNGTVRFYLPNLRASCRFYLLTGGAQFPMVVGSSNAVTFSNNNQASGVHTALAATYPDGSVDLRVSWNTLNATKPALKYGFASSDPGTIVPAQSKTFKASDMCDSPAKDRGWFDPGTLHTAVVKGVPPGKSMWYALADVSGDDAVWSLKRTVAAQPKPSDSIKIIAFGDMGNAGRDGSLQHSWDYQNHGEMNAVNTTDAILGELSSSDPISLVLHIGDIAYAVGYLAEWDQFMAQIEPVADKVPWMTAIGNHEMGYAGSTVPGSDSGGECGIVYSTRFPMPCPACTQTPAVHWYSFNHGPMHVTVMSTEHPFDKNTPQWTWLQKDLAAVDRKVTPWVVFAGHRPMYVDSDWDTDPVSDQGMARHLRSEVEPLLKANAVDLAMWGHHHSYQRTHPVYNTTVVDGGTTHVVIGMAGYWLSHNFVAQLPTYLAVANDTTWGYTRMMVNESNLQMQFVSDTDGSVVDDFTLSH